MSQIQVALINKSLIMFWLHCSYWKKVLLPWT